MTFSNTDSRDNRNSRQPENTSGCLPGFLIPPLVVLCFGLMMAASTHTASSSSNAPTRNLSADGVLAPLFTAEIQHWAGSLARWAAEHGLDPNIAATVMQIESCGDPQALSSAGAAGLFQVMPFHFLVNENAFDPETNALRGLAYLAQSLKTSGGDARLALAGYNGGISVINRGETSWANETNRYAYWGSGIYADAIQNAASSERLNEWLAAGGASLCRTARQRLGITQ